jgi:hypothetical protein
MIPVLDVRSTVHFTSRTQRRIIATKLELHILLTDGKLMEIILTFACSADSQLTLFLQVNTVTDLWHHVSPLRRHFVRESNSALEFHNNCNIA